MHEVHKFYTALYKLDPAIPGLVAEREVVLWLTTKNILEEDYLTMMEVPSDNEIDKIVANLPWEKSPGIDGVIAEILQKFWPVMRPTCIAMIRAFWADRTLTTRAAIGVLKLVPKSEEVILLLNWGPLTMLTLIEKLCVKLLGKKFKTPTSKVINRQQTGFLEGRSPMDNLLTYKLTQELVNKTKQESWLLKANFMKAYDRVVHLFIWSIMAALGYHPYLILLAKGLVEKAGSAVHVNGYFTESIKLERGVQHACPMSSLLFTISTQPLMLMLQEQVNLGEIEGIHIGHGKQLTHQLFADDTRIFIAASERNFNKVREVISRYKAISGASLNLSKSMVIPMHLQGSILVWLANSSYKVATKKEVVTYPGCPIGYGLTASQEAEFHRKSQEKAEELVKQNAELGQQSPTITPRS